MPRVNDQKLCTSGIHRSTPNIEKPKYKDQTIEQSRVGLETKRICDSLAVPCLPPGGPSVPFSHVHCKIERLAATTVVDISGQAMQDVFNACNPQLKSRSTSKHFTI